jgi:Flp pilus assembly protein TadG
MKAKCIHADTQGAVLVEAAITLPLFILTIFIVVELGLLIWTQAGLQHGVEMAARCASVNTTLCGTPTEVKSFAVAQSLGVKPPASTFSYTANTTCGTGGNTGNLVTASYNFSLFGIYTISMTSLTLSAHSCFPI